MQITRPRSARRFLEEAIVPLLERGAARFVLSDLAGPSRASSASEAAAPAHNLPSRFLSARHAHGVYEICWVIEGRCVLAFDTRDVDLAADDVCLVRPGEVHQLDRRHIEKFWCPTLSSDNLLIGVGGD